MNRDSQHIFENYVQKLVEKDIAPKDDLAIPANQGVNTAAPVPVQPPAPAAGNPEQQAAEAGVTQTDVLAQLIAAGDEQFLKQLFAIPAVAELMKSKTQPAPAAATAAAPAPQAPQAPAAQAPATPAGNPAAPAAAPARTPTQ